MGLGLIWYVPISRHTVVYFRYMSFSVQSGSFSVHRHFTMTILGHDSEECRYIKISILVRRRNASIFYIEMVGHYLMRLLATKCNRTAIESQQVVAWLCRS